MQLSTKELLGITALLLKYAESKGHTVVQFANQDSWYQKISYEDRDFEGGTTKHHRRSGRCS